MSSFAFSFDQRRALEAVCDTFVQRLSKAQEDKLVKNNPQVPEAHLRAYCKSNGSDLGLAAAVEAAVAAHLPPHVQSELSTLLTALSTRIGTFLLCGAVGEFASLSLEARESCLNGLQDSVFGAKRKAFVALKAIVGNKAFSTDTSAINPHNAGKVNSMWAALGWDGPAVDPQAVGSSNGGEFVYRMLNDTITKDTVLDVDAVIVGSGCGGGVVAGELAQAGYRVLVLEKGPYFRRSQITGVEGDAFDRMYERGGLLTTEDTGMAVLAGATFGGGSAVNWACSLRTPDHVKKEWATEFGLKSFMDGTFDKSLDAVCSGIAVQSEGVAHSRSNALLIAGCKKCGYEISSTGQAMADVAPNCPGAALIGSGDPYGIKNSMPKNYLRAAAEAKTPAQFADRCFVDRVLHDGGSARGVEARIIGANGKSYALKVTARITVVAAGSIQSPALLLRSAIPNRNNQIGKNLRLHPVMGVVGVVPEGEPDVKLWEGAPMTTVSSAAVPGPRGDNYGSRIECPNALPGIAASIMPWASGSAYKELLLLYPRVFCTIVLSRDKDSGEVFLGRDGVLRLKYPFSEQDRESLMFGAEKAIRMVAGAGAASLALTHYKQPLPLPPVTEPKARAAEVDRIIADIKKMGFPAHKVALFSAHQMGTCRMGSDPKTSVVKPTCEAWECSNLYVVDASTFPTASGANPMITSLAIAHMAAQGLKGALAKAAARPPPSKL